MNTRKFSDEEVEEAQLAMVQRRRLRCVLEFLLSNGADQTLVDATEQAIIGNEAWANPELEAVLVVGDDEFG